jgi:hypothetical protein
MAAEYTDKLGIDLGGNLDSLGGSFLQTEHPLPSSLRSLP